MRSREELIAECDVILLAKPDADDLAELRDGQVLWGWPHCVQDTGADAAGDRPPADADRVRGDEPVGADGSFKLHVFHKNNEMAGYCSVLHALRDHRVDRHLRAPVAGRGDRLRRHRPRRGDGAERHGIHDIDILTNRDVTEVASPIHSAQIVQFDHDATRRRITGELRAHQTTAGCRSPAILPSTTSSSTACCRTPTRR